MIIHVYAGLKDYFHPEFELSGPVRNTEELVLRLAAMSEVAGPLLQTCRFAVGDAFISNEYDLHEQDTVHIIPPGSGG